MKTSQVAESSKEISNGSLSIELGAWSLLIVFLNIPLFLGSVPSMLFLTAPALSGDALWQWVTHPFAHVSLYHLLLDAGAFLTLYTLLPPSTCLGRVGLVAGSAWGSLAAALVSGVLIQSNGFCGLSGIAHGLMAIAGLDLARDRGEGRTLRMCGWMLFVIVVGKSIVEAFLGRVFFDSVHLGPVGNPIVACHAGGIVGGLIVYGAKSLLRNQSIAVAIEHH